MSRLAGLSAPDRETNEKINFDSSMGGSAGLRT